MRLLLLSIPQDAVPLSAEAFLLLLDVRAQGNATGQLDSKTCLTPSGRVFFLGRNKNPSVA